MIKFIGFILLVPVAVQAQDSNSLRPRPPSRFEVNAGAEAIELAWATHPGEPDPEAWEIYRTDEYVDKLPYTRIETLSGSSRSYVDRDIIRDTGYFYYIVAVGPPTPIDTFGFAGTPDGRPFRSSRYFAQTHDLTAVGVRPGIESDTLYQVGSNPFRDGTTFQYVARGPGLLQIKVYNTLGQEVAVLVDEFITDFVHGEAQWNASDHSGRPVPSGIYFCQLAVVPYYKMSVSVAVVR